MASPSNGYHAASWLVCDLTSIISMSRETPHGIHGLTVVHESTTAFKATCQCRKLRLAIMDACNNRYILLKCKRWGKPNHTLLLSVRWELQHWTMKRYRAWRLWDAYKGGRTVDITKFAIAPLYKLLFWRSSKTLAVTYISVLFIKDFSLGLIVADRHSGHMNTDVRHKFKTRLYTSKGMDLAIWHEEQTKKSWG